VTYEPNNKCSVNGSYLRSHVDGLSMNQIVLAFPAGKTSGFCDEEKGYYEHDCVFRDSETSDVFNVYSRFGAVRIGAHASVTDEAVEKFKSWLLSQF
jgi:hypothetical protein